MIIIFLGKYHSANAEFFSGLLYPWQDANLKTSVLYFETFYICQKSPFKYPFIHSWIIFHSYFLWIKRIPGTERRLRSHEYILHFQGALVPSVPSTQVRLLKKLSVTLAPRRLSSYFFAEIAALIQTNSYPEIKIKIKKVVLHGEKGCWLAKYKGKIQYLLKKISWSQD